MNTDDLIRRTVAAVVPYYRSVDLTNAAGLLLDTYWDGEPEQLAPSVYELTEVTPDTERDGYQEYLETQDPDRDSPARALCVELNDLVNSTGQDSLLDTYFLALADALHRELGLPVLAPDSETPIAEQLRRQLSTAPPPDPLAGLDVVVTWPLDDHRIAAVWRDEWGFVASGHAPADPESIGFSTNIGRNPDIRAGWLLPGAAGVSLQDRKGEWHQARTGEGAWLCVLPQRAGQKDPAMSYRDVEGTPFDRAVDVEGLPALWPRQAPEPGEPSQTSDTIHGYSGGGWHLWVLAHTGHARGVKWRPIPGTILGEPHGFGVAHEGHGRWRARAVCASFTVEIEATGELPTRLDLF